MINSLSKALPIADENGIMELRFSSWADNVTRLQVIPGTGSPEGVVTARQTEFYMDLAGVAGAILYIKRDADIAGNRKQGWILV